MAESIGPMLVQTTPKSKPNPGWDQPPPAGRPRAPGKRTRREDHALLIVRDEFRTGYSSTWLLASIARLRFTGIVRIALDRAPGKELSSNGNGVFSLVSHEWGSPHQSAFIGVYRRPRHLISLLFRGLLGEADKPAAPFGGIRMP